MKKSLIAALAALSLFSFADTPPPPAPIAAPVEGAAAGKPRRSRPVVDRGGFLTRKTEGGVVRFVDIREKGAMDISRLVADCASVANVAGETVRAERREGTESLTVAKAALADNGVAIAIVVCDDGSDSPSLIVCPEDRMAVVNVGKLKDADAAVFEKRLKSEMLRAVGFVLGGYASVYPGVMKPVYKVADLDSLPPVFPPPVQGFIHEGASTFKVAKTEHVPYAVAVKEGWAPPPTNDIQKAVWDRVMAAKAAATNAPATTPSAK